jgi:hypothetical protein
MSRYSPSVQPDAGRPLDFSGLSDALGDIQRKRRDRERLALDTRRLTQQEEEEQYRRGQQREAETNAIRAQGGTSLMERDLGRPEYARTATSAVTSLAGEPIQPMLHATPRPARNPALQPYYQSVGGEQFEVDPGVPARRTAALREEVEGPERARRGASMRTLLSTSDRLRGQLAGMTDDQLGDLPPGSIDDILRASQPVRATPPRRTLKETRDGYVWANEDTAEISPALDARGRRVFPREPKGAAPKDDTPKFLLPTAERDAAVKLTEDRRDMFGDVVSEGLPPGEAATTARGQVKKQREAAFEAEMAQLREDFATATEQAGTDAAKAQRVASRFLDLKTALGTKYGIIRGGASAAPPDAREERAEGTADSAAEDRAEGGDTAAAVAEQDALKADMEQALAAGAPRAQVLERYRAEAAKINAKYKVR